MLRCPNAVEAERAAVAATISAARDIFIVRPTSLVYLGVMVSIGRRLAAQVIKRWLRQR